MMPRNDDYRILNLEQQLADVQAKRMQAERALANLRESFDAIQGVSLVQSQERIKELEERIQNMKVGFDRVKSELISADALLNVQDKTIRDLQSKNAKQKEALAKLNEREKRTRESIRDAREDSKREYLDRVSEMEEREKAQARIEELEAKLEKAETRINCLKVDYTDQLDVTRYQLRIRGERIDALKATLADEKGKNGQLEHAMENERVRFDRLMAEYNRVRNGDFGKAEERVVELESELEETRHQLSVEKTSVETLRTCLIQVRDRNTGLEAYCSIRGEELSKARERIKELEARIEKLESRLRAKAETIFNLEQSLIRAWKKNDAPK